MITPAELKYRRDLLVTVLVYHQRLGAGCVCGWGSRPEHLGRSHAEHVADAFEAASTGKVLTR